MECKDYGVELARMNDIRFNRDIVECKDDITVPTSLTELGFNRDIVECKVTLLFTLLFKVV